MAVKRCEANIDVVKAAEIRIKNVFGNGLPVFFSFSGGKDSLCVAQLMVNLANRGEIDMKQLTVQFIDEEAIFPCMEDMTKKWRRIFMMMGAKFEWYCVEVKHFNCFNELSNDETFICWDSAKQDVWVRQPPSFAIRNHKLLRPRIDAYQDFLPRTTVSGITMVGIRTAESVFGCKMLSSTIGGLHGGGAVLTPQAEQILAAYKAYCADLEAYSQKKFESAFSFYRDLDKI